MGKIGIGGHRTLAALAASAALLALAACGGGHSPMSGMGPGAGADHTGSDAPAVSVSGAYIPRPASPDVAAVYLTLDNTGSGPVHLLSATSPVASRVTPMRDVVAHGASSMQRLAHLEVPAGARVRLQPSGAHLMLEHLNRTLHVGDKVLLHLRFTGGGVVSVSVPVTPLMSGPPDPSASPSASTSRM